MDSRTNLIGPVRSFFATSPRRLGVGRPLGPREAFTTLPGAAVPLVLRRRGAPTVTRSPSPSASREPSPSRFSGWSVSTSGSLAEPLWSEDPESDESDRVDPEREDPAKDDPDSDEPEDSEPPRPGAPVDCS